MFKLFKQSEIYYCNFDKSYFEYSPFDVWRLNHKYHRIACPYCGRVLTKTED